MKQLYYLLFISAIFAGCNNSKTNFISFKNSNIQYTGRINLNQDSAAIIYWPGSSIKIRFKGTGLKVLLKDSKGENYFNVILDYDSIFILSPDTIKTVYNLVSNIQDKEHIVEIFKRTEWDKGSTQFYGFELSNSSKLLNPTPISNKTIEFFGNSITAGYANSDTTNDNPDGLFTNNYLAYGAITARHYNANYYCTAKGGIGIMISWFPLIMNEMYNRLNPEDSSSIWDFSKISPNIIVINLFQNDSWLVNMPEHPEFKAKFGTNKPDKELIIRKYKEFVQKVRNIYPKAKIICTLGSMDATLEGSEWPKYIKKAVIQIDDPNIFTHFFPYINKDDHPKIKDHQIMSESLIKFIDENELWER